MLLDISPGKSETEHTTNSSSDTITPNGISLLRVLRSMGKGAIIAVTPSISRVLQMFDPITFPTDMSPSPLNADTNDT